MTNSTNRNIVIWAYGKFVALANEAVLMYQSEYSPEVTFQVVDMHSSMEVYDRLTVLNEIGDESSFNELPNILLVHDEELKQYVEEFPGLFQSLDNYMDTSMFMSYKLANVTHQNGTYGFPCSSYPVALYYRKDILDDIGMTFSDNLTWDDFIYIGEELKEIENKYLLAFSNNLTQILMQSTGQLYYDADGNISSTGAEEVLTLMDRLRESEVISFESNVFDEELIDRMIQGDIVSIIGAPWLFTMIKDKVAEMNLTQEWAVARIPKSEVVTNEVNLGGCSWMVLDKGEDDDQELVLDFLERMFGNNQEMVRKLAESDIVPVTCNAWSQLNNLDNNGCFYNQQVIQFLAELGAEAPEIYYGTYTDEMTEELNEIAMEVLGETISVSTGYSEFEACCAYYDDLDPPPESLPDTSPDESILLQLLRIEIEKEPNKINYYAYEKFKPEGMIVRAYFTDGTDQIVTDYSWTPLRLDLNTSSVTISYSSDKEIKITKTAQVNVSVSKEKANASKLNQTELKYSCGAGDASINLFTKRLLFEHQDMSIGVNSYQIGVSHVYNSDFDENVDLRYGLEESSYFKTYMGKGFKLNVQQYVFAIDDHYVYIDGAGYRHKFVELGDGQSYYDTSGLGLILTFEDNQKVISDEAGNKMYFDALGRLEKTVSCHNEALVKKFVYNSKGQLVLVYDNRTASNQIKFTYSSTTNLLKTMTCGYANSENDLRTINYTYNSNGWLTEITDEQGGAKFVYDTTNKIMKFAVSKPDNYALKFENTDGKVTGVIEGAYDEGSASIPEGNIRKRNYYTTIENGKGVTVCDQKGTTADPNKDLNINYYFNRKGFTTAILEANNGNSNDLRSMKKMPGVSIAFPSNVNTYESKINQQKAYGYPCSYTYIMDISNEVIDYRRNKYTGYQYYSITFWLWIKGELLDPTVTVKITSDGKVDESKVFVDNTAIGVWQYVTVPIKITNDTIQNITLKVSGLFETAKDCKMSDMRLTYAAYPGYYIKAAGETNWAPMDSATEIHYTLKDSTKLTKETVNADCYMSGKDLQSTFLSMYKSQCLSGIGEYVLSLCDGRRKLLVKNAKIKVSKAANEENIEFYRGFPLKFDTIESEEYALALYNHETISPDGSTSTYGYVRFYPSVALGTYNGSAIMQLIKSTRGDVVTESYVYVDLKGRVLQECDEYGVTTTYEYDNYGSVTKKTVSHKDGEGETFVYEAMATDSSITETTVNSYMKTTCDQLLGRVVSSQYCGNRETGNVNIYNTWYTYDPEHRLDIISNGYGKNSLAYDNQGRLEQVCALDFNSDLMYGYKTEYNMFGEPLCHKLLDQNAAETTLVTKDINSSRDRVILNQYRGETPDETVINLDKYGRITSVMEGSKTTMFSRQDLWESAGATEVVTMEDPYEEKTYTYSYDEFNNLTGYAHEEMGEGGKEPFSLKKTGPTEVTYTLSRDSVEKLVSTIEYDSDKIVSPRVKKVKNLTKLYAGSDCCSIMEYTYDKFGRIEKKENTINTGSQSDLLAHVITDYTYKRGTVLKERITVQSKGSDNSIVESYDFDYGYDSRGRVLKSSLEKDGVTTETEYVYNQYDQLISEKKDGITKQYYYRPDGSLEYEYIGTEDDDGYDIHHFTQYIYDIKGRLSKFYEDGTEISEYQYDTLGNCTRYTNRTEIEWERGSLMKKFGNTTYSYNAQGVRFKKDENGTVTEYLYDGGKLLAETEYKIITDDESPDRELVRERVYFYDLEGIVGFGTESQEYTYVKDAFGSVISILRGNEEVARYSYDPWGKCTMLKNVDNIAMKNPIRWKSLYYDVESGLYYIDGRYYSPETRQFLSPLPAETMFSNALTVFGLNPYLVTLDNCVNRLYNGYTIHPSVELAYDPLEMSDWTWFWSVAWPRFWNSMWEWTSGFGEGYTGYGAVILAETLAVLALAAGIAIAIFCPAVGVLGFIGSIASSACISASFAISANLTTQIKSKPLNEFNLNSALISGVEGFVIGAITGAFSGCLQNAFKTVGAMYGEYVGKYLSNMTIGGLNLAKAFSYLGGVNMFVGAGRFIGGALGIFMCGAFGNEIAYNMNGINPSPEQNMQEGTQGTIIDYIINWLRWVLGK